MDGETVGPPLLEGQGQREGAEPTSVPGGTTSQLNGVDPRPESKKAKSTSRVGTLFSEMSAAVQGVAAKAKSGMRRAEQSGPGSAGTEATVGTTGTGYVTATSEVEGAYAVEGFAGGRRDQVPLFSAEQVERLESMSRTAPLLYPEGQAQTTPELPHSVSSGSGDAIQVEVRRQLQQFMVAQSELERRIAYLQQENEELRRGATGIGSEHGMRGWFGGLGRGLMGLVQQVPGRSGSPPFIPPKSFAVSPQAGSTQLLQGCATTGQSVSVSPGPGLCASGPRSGAGASGPRSGAGASGHRSSTGAGTSGPRPGTGASTGAGASGPRPGTGAFECRPGTGASGLRSSAGASSSKSGRSSAGASGSKSGAGASEHRPGTGASGPRPGAGASEHRPGAVASWRRSGTGASGPRSSAGAASHRSGTGISRLKPVASAQALSREPGSPSRLSGAWGFESPRCYVDGYSAVAGHDGTNGADAVYLLRRQFSDT